MVTLDGRPLDMVLVTFTPEDSGANSRVRSMGLSDSSGTFKLRAETQDDGALIGNHRVTIEDLAIYEAPRAEEGEILSMPTVRFPKVYTDPIRTPLQVTVRDSEQRVSLELVSRP
jgi:hypothetical protein